MLKSVCRFLKVSKQSYPVCISNKFNVRQFCNISKFSQKILEILDQNKHKTITPNSTEEQVSECNNDSHQLSEYENEMDALIRMNTKQSMSEALKLFQSTKSNINIQEIDIDTLYSPAIRLILSADLAENGTDIASKKAFNKMIALKEEIDSKNKNERGTIKCDTMIISSCLKVKQYKEILNIFEDILRNKEKDKYFKDREFCIAMMKYYGDNNYVFEGIKFMKDIEIKYGMLPNNQMLYELLASIAFNINKENKMLYLQCVETLFEQTFGDKNIDKYPNILIFQSILDIYSKLGDIKTCWNIMHFMIDNKECCNPNVICYNLVLRSCLKCDDNELLINNQNGWYFIDDILNQMEQYNVFKNAYIFDTLFLFCGSNTICNKPNFERLKGFYDEMIEQKVRVSLITLSDWIMSAIDWFEYEIINNNNNCDDEKMKLICKQLFDFKEFAIKECERMNRCLPLETIHNIDSRAASIHLLTSNDFK